MKVQSIEAVKRCVMNNLGIAVVPTYAIEEELKNGALVPVKTELDEKIYNSVYVYHKNKWLSPQITLALDLLQGVYVLSRLVVIGNGFDLAHGLHTKYSDFMEYLISYEQQPKVIQGPFTRNLYRNNV